MQLRIKLAAYENRDLALAQSVWHGIFGPTTRTSM